MSDFGHAIGVPAAGGPGREWPPYGHDEPGPPDELDLAGAHARARVLAEAGEITGARTIIEEALAAAELRLGRDDPALVPLMVDLATLARRLGNLTEARNQLRRAYAISVTASGVEHPTSLAIEGRLSAVAYRLGEATEAYDQHLAEIGTRVLGPDHPAVRGAQQRLARGAAAAPSAPPTAAGPSAPSAPSVTPPHPAAPSPVQPAPPRVAMPVPPPPPPMPAPMQTSPYGPAIEGDIWEPARTEEPTQRTRQRRTGVALVFSLAAVVLVGGIVVALQLFGPGVGAPDPVSGQTAESPAPTASPPPTDIELDDAGETVTLTWTDPSNGTVLFVVSGGIEGNALFVIESVPAGRTTATVYGVNVNFNYCFTVAAVWSSEDIQESERSCTDRVQPTASAG